MKSIIKIKALYISISLLKIREDMYPLSARRPVYRFIHFSLPENIILKTEKKKTAMILVVNKSTLLSD